METDKKMIDDELMGVAVQSAEAVDVEDNGSSDTNDEGCRDSKSCESETVNDVVDYEALIAEAEERGYLRGRNERIEEIMKMPADEVPVDDTEILILNNIKPSVWE